MKQRPLQLLLTFNVLNGGLTTTEKTKLSGIAEGANKTTVTASAETLTITIN